MRLQIPSLHGTPLPSSSPAASHFSAAGVTSPTQGPHAVPFALQAGQCQIAAQAGKAKYAKFCIAAKVGSPLATSLGMLVMFVFCDMRGRVSHATPS